HTNIAGRIGKALKKSVTGIQIFTTLLYMAHWNVIHMTVGLRARIRLLLRPAILIPRRISFILILWVSGLEDHFL
ncbi:MAG: hypothetical protein ABGX30_01510, partial [bacterium]